MTAIAIAIGLAAPVCVLGWRLLGIWAADREVRNTGLEALNLARSFHEERIAELEKQVQTLSLKELGR